MKCSEVHYSADESSAVEDSTEYCTLSEVQRVWFRECGSESVVQRVCAYCCVGLLLCGPITTIATR